MYKTLLEELTSGHNWAKLAPPCPEEEIQKAERYVGYAFPAELKALLRELDGDGWLILSAKEIVETVRINREVFPQFFDDPNEYDEKIDRHIFFAANGCGDHYCYRVLEGGEVDDSAIYIWEHETFEHHIVAKDIPDLICKYYNDEI